MQRENKLYKYTYKTVSIPEYPVITSSKDSVFVISVFESKNKIYDPWTETDHLKCRFFIYKSMYENDKKYVNISLKDSILKFDDLKEKKNNRIIYSLSLIY